MTLDKDQNIFHVSSILSSLIDFRAPRPTFPTKQVGISYFEENSPTFPTFYQFKKMLL